MIQFGGQTPLKLARAIEAAGFKVLGTPYEAVDLAEDRERFGQLLAELGIRCPEWGIADAPDAAVEIAERVGYPVLVRPVVRARRPGDARLLRRGAGARARWPASRAPSSSIASSRARSRSTSTRSATASPSTSAP